MHDMLSFFREFRWLLLVFFFLLLTHGAVPAGESPLPVDAQKAVAVCDAAIAKARGEMVKSLRAALVKTTKAGDLAGANSVQTLIVETEKLLVVNKDPRGNKNSIFVGDYVCNFWHRGETIRVTEKRIERITMKEFAGSWVLNKDKLTINWDNGGVTVCDEYDSSDRSWKESASGFKITPAGEK